MSPCVVTPACENGRPSAVFWVNHGRKGSNSIGTLRPLRPGEALTTFRRYAANDDGAFMMLEKLGELAKD